MSMEQVLEWHQENEIWATALVDPVSMKQATTVPPEVKALLDSYSDIFAEPDTLPPSRAYDHAIHLLPGAAPVNA